MGFKLFLKKFLSDRKGGFTPPLKRIWGKNWPNGQSFSRAGFTLIEVLVALFIFGVASTATSYVLVTNINSAFFVKDSYIASGLAQEGIEVVRNLRDQDGFLNNPFGTSIPDGTYRVQWSSLSLIALGGNPPLREDTTTGFFSYYTGTNTIFTRTLVITTVVPAVEKKVVVNVNWTERGVLKTLSAEEHLFNWK